MDRNLIIIQIIIFFCTSSVSLLSPFLPPLARSMNISYFTIGLILSTESLCGMIQSLTLGNWILRNYKKAGMIIGLIFFTFGITGFGLIYFIEKSKTLFLFFAFLSSCIMAFNYFAFLVVFAIVPLYWPEDIDNIIENIEGVGTFGYISGPIVGSIMYNLAGQPAPFILIAGITVIVLIPLVSTMKFEKVTKTLLEQQELSTKKSQENFFKLFLKLPVIAMLLLFLAFYSGQDLIFNQLSDYLIRIFKFDQSKINYAQMIMGGLYICAVMGLKLFKINQNAKVFIYSGSIISIISLIFIGPDPIMNIKPSAWTFYFSMLGLHVGQALIIIPMIPFWTNLFRKKYNFDIEEAANLASLFYNLSFSAGDLIGPVIGGELIDIIGFERSSSQCGIAIIIFLIFCWVVFQKDFWDCWKKIENKSENENKIIQIIPNNDGNENLLRKTEKTLERELRIDSLRESEVDRFLLQKKE